MPTASTGPPAVGSPRMPLPPAVAAPAAATGVVVFSQPATPSAPRPSAAPPARRNSDRRESPASDGSEGPFNAAGGLAERYALCQSSHLNVRSGCDLAAQPLADPAAAAVAQHAVRRVVARRGDHAAAR